MSNKPHSNAEDRLSRPPSGPSTGRRFHRRNAGSSNRGGLANLALQGLGEILESFFIDPDFHRLYERNPRNRLIHSWNRVGDSMQLALGRSTTLTMTYPDGRRMRRVVGPRGSNAEHRATLDKMRQATWSPDRDDADDLIVISIAGQRADRLMAHIDEDMRSRPARRQ